MKATKIVVALAGNPNVGKSTIFNSLTGARQHIGNYPGVTVEKKTKILQFKGYQITVVDLPGTYSLSSYTEDERVTRDFIINEKPDVIINIIDSSNLERNLYLTTQLIEMEVPLVLAMNMIDIAERKGQILDCVKLSKLLGGPIVSTVGSKNIGTRNILETAVKMYEAKSEQKKVYIDYGEEILQETNILRKIIEKDRELIKKYPWRWLVINLLENDSSALDIVSKFSVSQEILRQKEKSRKHLRAHFGENPEIIITDRRYGFVSGACAESVDMPIEEKNDISDKIDRVVLNRFLGLPIFALIMYAIFKFTFTCSEPIVSYFERLFELLGVFATTYIPKGLLQSFVVDGVIGGVGSVLGFFPLILFMFFAISFFEDSGYMARAAFVMDKLMSKFGLHGKSFLPLIISTNGCAIPGLMATRTLESKKDRLVTMMVIPFMICGAKLPIFALFIGAFFPTKYGANIMLLMYALSFIVALTSAWVLKKFIFKGEATHFVMELPPYRVPSLKGLLLKMWERGWSYIKGAATITLLFSIIVWAAFTFPLNTKLEETYAGRVSKIAEPFLKPIGLDGRSGIALIAGLAAKEVVVSTFGTIYAVEEVDVEQPEALRSKMQRDPFWNPLKALVFLIFCLTYIPCIAAVVVFYRETGSQFKWVLFLIFWTTALAWVGSFILYKGGLLLGFGG